MILRIMKQVGWTKIETIEKRRNTYETVLSLYDQT